MKPILNTVTEAYLPLPLGQRKNSGTFSSTLEDRVQGLLFAQEFLQWVDEACEKERIEDRGLYFHYEIEEAYHELKKIIIDRGMELTEVLEHYCHMNAPKRALKKMYKEFWNDWGHKLEAQEIINKGNPGIPTEF